MNIEIANRLFEYRKQQGLSQEELAERIGVSRQAVSKWERAESSPDTDNLIELARLYGVSLDSLLFTDEPTKKDPASAEEHKKTDYVSVGWDGIHVIDGDEEVHVSLKGIYIKDGDEEVVIGGPGARVTKGVVKDLEGIRKKYWFVNIGVAVLCTAAYLTLGFGWGYWHPSWLIFFAVPFTHEVLNMFALPGIRNKLNQFPVWVLSTVGFLVLGFYFRLWHPGWVVFLVIPAYYWLVSMIPRGDHPDIDLDDLDENFC